MQKVSLIVLVIILFFMISCKKDAPFDFSGSWTAQNLDDRFFDLIIEQSGNDLKAYHSGGTNDGSRIDSINEKENEPTITGKINGNIAKVNFQSTYTLEVKGKAEITKNQDGTISWKIIEIKSGEHYFPDEAVLKKADASGISNDKSDNTDPLQSVNDKVELINKNLSSYKKITKQDSENSSTEGNDIIIFQNNDNQIEKIEASFLGETGKKLLEYYLSNEKVIFVLEKISTYDSPFGKITKEVINSYYFNNGEIYKVSDSEGTIFDLDDKTIIENIDLLTNNVEKYKKL